MSGLPINEQILEALINDNFITIQQFSQQQFNDFCKPIISNGLISIDDKRLFMSSRQKQTYRFLKSL